MITLHKVLRGFKRVALKPKETKTISIEVMKKDLAWYNPNNKKWEVEDIKYTIYVGSSSNNEDLLTTQISL
ncbi:MAG: fibronectin type III-like domain-contianing protein [Promethearchaeota archaeon]